MPTLDLDSLVLRCGSHDGPEDGFCIMEAVAYAAGETWTERPQCCCPVIALFMRMWNDGLKTDEDRTRLLSSLIHRLINTKSSPAIELKRSWMAFDWLVRECAPAFLSLKPSLVEHADTLRCLPELDQSNFDLAADPCAVARNAAGAAALEGDWDAARDVTRNAAVDAAWMGATNAEKSVAGAAERATADVAWTTAWATAGVTADALQTTVTTLQQSALQLVERMLACK